MNIDYLLNIVDMISNANFVFFTLLLSLNSILLVVFFNLQKEKIALIKERNDYKLSRLRSENDLLKTTVNFLKTQQSSYLLGEINAKQVAFNREKESLIKEKENLLKQQNSLIPEFQIVDQSLSGVTTEISNIEKIKTSIDQDFDNKKGWRWRERQSFFMWLHDEAHDRACKDYEGIDVNLEVINNHKNKLIADKIQELGLSREYEEWKLVMAFYK